MKKLLLIIICMLAAPLFANAQTVGKQAFDFIVPDNGDFRVAIHAANTRPDQSARFRIFLRRGDYTIPASKEKTVMGMDSIAYPDPRTDLTASNVTIIGEGLEVTRVRNTCPTNLVQGQWGPACPIEGLGKAYVLKNCGENNVFEGFSLINGMADKTGRGEAFEDCGDRTICRNMGLFGYQDTYFSNREGGRYYFEGGVIRGRTDYVCGKGDVVFNGVEFRHCDTKGYITAPSKSARHGYVMLDCIITGEKEGIDGTFTLGRPWNDSPRNFWINTRCMIKPAPEGWGVMSGNRHPVRMAEYNSMDADGRPLDLSRRKREWFGHENNPILTKEEAEKLTIRNVLGAWAEQYWDEAAYREIEARISAPRFREAAFDIRSFGAKSKPNISSDSIMSKKSRVSNLSKKSKASKRSLAAKNQKAINRAIATCSAKGGGRVVVPEGVFLTGAITLQSNVCLVLEKGAVLRFAFEPELYPLAYTHWEGLDCWNYQPCIYARNAENIGISGEGTIDGNGSNETFWQWNGVPRFGFSESTKENCRYPRTGEELGARDRLQKMCEDGTPIEQRRFGKGCGLRPQLVNFVECQNILIEGVTMLNSPFWVMHPLFSKNITVREVTVQNDGPNGDGCDPESCEDVLIERCHFDTGDDCIAIKSGRNADGRRHNRPSRNIIVRDCDMRDGHGGVVIGSEVSGGCSNVFVENCRMDSPNLDRVLRIKSNECRGGVVENIYMRNVTVGQCREAVMRINLKYQPGEKAEGGHLPTVRNVWMENVTCQKSKYGVLLNGLDNVKNVKNVEDIDVVENLENTENPERNRIYNINIRNCHFNGVTDKMVHRTGLSHDLHLDVGHYAERMVQSEMQRTPDPLRLDFAERPKWTYVVGIELEAMLDVYLKTKDERILNYLSSYVERMIDDEGNVVKYRYEDFNLDNIRPAHFLYRFNKIVQREGNAEGGTRRSGNEAALRTFLRQLENQPRTEDGVFWHKAIYRDQVWLDGIFMGLPFWALVAADDSSMAIDEAPTISTSSIFSTSSTMSTMSRMSKNSQSSQIFDDIISQISTTHTRTYDPATGLWKHAYDSHRSIFWADPATGLSKHSWARAMGWFTMAMIEVLDALPHDHPRRDELIAMFRNTLAAVVKCQDRETGVWHDVLDVDDPRNYLESTASCMFAYCLLKGARLGYLDSTFRQAGEKAWRGILQNFIKENPDGTISLTNCCAVSGLGPESNPKRDGSFDYYMSEPVRDNDGKGIGPFIWAALEAELLAPSRVEGE